MKKVLILAIAAAMLLGSFAKAEEVSDWDREHGEAQIQTGMINGLEYMIQDMEGMKIKADQLYSQDGVSRVGDITKLVEEAQIIREEALRHEDANTIDRAYGEISKLKELACQISQCDRQN